MKRLILCLFIAASMAAQAQEDSTVKVEKVKQLMVVMQQDSVMIKTMQAVSSSMAQNLSSLYEDGMNEKEEETMRKIQEKYFASVMDESTDMALKFLNNDMVHLYAKYFSLEDIDNMIEFYQSKTGKKLLHESPNISKEAMNIMMQKYQPDMQKNIKGITEQMKKEIEELMEEDE